MSGGGIAGRLTCRGSTPRNETPTLTSTPSSVRLGCGPRASSSRRGCPSPGWSSQRGRRGPASAVPTSGRGRRGSDPPCPQRGFDPGPRKGIFNSDNKRADTVGPEVVDGELEQRPQQRDISRVSAGADDVDPSFDGRLVVPAVPVPAQHPKSPTMRASPAGWRRVAGAARWTGRQRSGERRRAVERGSAPGSWRARCRPPNRPGRWSGSRWCRCWKRAARGPGVAAHGRPLR